MLERLNQFIIRCSFSAWKFILLFAGFIGSLQVLNMISDKFKLQAGGHEPFDLQNGLTAGQIYEQLSTYTEQAFLLYYSFTAVDYLFPLFAGFFLAAIWAFVLRHTNSRWYEVALQNNLFVLLLVPTFFDYAENIAILSTLLLWPEQAESFTDAVVVAKRAKLVTVVLAQGSTLLVLIYGSVKWIQRRLK